MDSAAAGRGRGGEVARGLMFNEAAADWEIGCRPPRLLMSPPPPPPTHPHWAEDRGLGELKLFFFITCVSLNDRNQVLW